MNYFVHHQQQQHQQEYDPSSQNQQSYDQFTNNYSYSYSYPNPNPPQFSYAYQNPVVQPSQHEEQEPNPPGVSLPLPEINWNSYYQYPAYAAAAAVPTAAPQPGAVDAGVQTMMIHQPIVQPTYGGVGIVDGIVPSGDPQAHLGPYPNVLSGQYHVALNAARPFPDQTVTAYGGLYIQGGPYQNPSQSYGETHHVPRSKVSGRRGRGRGGIQRKHAVASAQDLIFGASSFGQTPVPLQGPAQPASVPPNVSCELCKIECNTLEVLQQHMNGKKHKKKLKVVEDLQNLNQKKLKVVESLQNLNQKVLSGQAEQTPTTETKSKVISQPDRAVVSPKHQTQQEALPSQEINEESNNAGGKRKVEEAEVGPPEESAKKTRVYRSESTRVGRGTKSKLKGGKSNRKMRPSKSLVQPPKPKEVSPLVCELCNVKCESLVVFQSHLTGKKHISKAKRFMVEETHRQEFIQPQRPVDQYNATAPTIGFLLHDQGFASSQNVQISNGQGFFVQSGVVEGISQPVSLVTTNSGSSVVVTAAGATWNEGSSESGACSKNSVAAGMVGIAGGSDVEYAVTCRASLDGGSSSVQNAASIMQQQQQPLPN